MRTPSRANCQQGRQRRCTECIVPSITALRYDAALSSRHNQRRQAWLRQWQRLPKRPLPTNDGLTGPCGDADQKLPSVHVSPPMLGSLIQLFDAPERYAAVNFFDANPKKIALKNFTAKRRRLGYSPGFFK
jgi:hypothetical protein